MSARPSASLEAFSANLHFLFIIQEDDEIFEEAMNKFFLPDVKEK